jgi:hypothetical protein
VKKLTGGFDNGLGAVLIGERSLALSFVSFKEIARRHFGTFSTVSTQTRHSLKQWVVGAMTATSQAIA